MWFSFDKIIQFCSEDVFLFWQWPSRSVRVFNRILDEDENCNRVSFKSVEWSKNVLIKEVVELTSYEDTE